MLHMIALSLCKTSMFVSQKQGLQTRWFARCVARCGVPRAQHSSFFLPLIRTLPPLPGP